VDVFVSYGSVGDITCCEINVNLFFMYHGSMAEKRQFKYPHNNRATIVAIVSQRLSPHPISTVLELQKAVHTGNTVGPIFLRYKPTRCHFSPFIYFSNTLHGILVPSQP
jgi:hypothetical protein